MIMDDVEAATLLMVLLHEKCHIMICRLLRVQITKLYLLPSKKKTGLIIENPGMTKTFLIRLFPWFFDLFFGMKEFEDNIYFRILWLKYWFSTKKGFAKCILSELREK